MADKIKPQTAKFRESIKALYFDNALDGLAYCQVVFDEQGHSIDFIFLQVNKGFERLTGLKDAVGKKASEFIPEIKTTNPEMFEHYEHVVLSQKPERFETYIEPLSRWFLVTVYSLNKNFFVASFQNITARKRIETDLKNAKVAARNVLEDLQVEKEKLVEAKAKDDALLESIGDAVFACNLQGRISLFNKVAEELTGVTAEEAIGRHYLEVVNFVNEGDEHHKHDWIADAITSNQATKMPDHTVLVRKDGRKIPVADSAAPIKDANGKTYGCVVVFRDFTREREIERIKAEFISIASHQLRTPVSGLNWLTEVLESDLTVFPAKQKRYIKDLSIYAKRLVVLIEDLLNFSRIELKTNTMTEKEKIEISACVQEFIKEMTPYADSKKHQIIFNNKIAKPLTIEINKRSLYNVLQNLLSNAIDYSPENTVVTVNLMKDHDFMKISVSNQGPTIPKEDQPKIFTRFYRSERAKRIKAEGTGLGLYIVKAIIEGMGGKVGFESVEGKETVFWFSVPLKNNN